MVKNLPTVERSTKIRFGRNVPDSDVQAENTIIINASNTLITTPNSGSIYMAPVKFRNDIADPNIVLMMYNRETGELSESGESANVLVGGQTLNATTDRGNITSNTVQFLSPTTGIVTVGKVGVSNLLPGHTLSIGSNVYIDDTGSNVLVISGGVLLSGNLTVNGGVTTITTENLKIKDAIIELGQNNTSGDTTLDLGLIMTRPQSNVTIGFLETSKEIVIGFTESSADSNVITPLTSEDINVHVYGRLYTEANVGILNTDPMHTLDVGSNLYVDEFGSNILVVTGNTSVSGDLTVDSGTLYVDVGNKSIGLGTVNPTSNLHVVGNAYISSTTDSTTTTTGALIVAGGIGVAGKIYGQHANLQDVEADSLTVTDVTQASSNTTGAVIVSGGLGVAKGVFSATVNATDQTDATSKTTGAVIVSGGLGVTKNIHGKDIFVEDIVSNSVVVLDTTQASSNTTGAVIISGGLGVAKGVFSATVNATDQTDATSKTTGAVIVSGGLGVTKNIYAKNVNFEDVEADSVTITDTTQSTNQTSGALIVAGGLGVSGNVHCGNLRVNGNVTITGNTLVIDANTLRIKDPLIELGKNNNDGVDLGIIMHNPLINKGNVALIYDFSESVFEIGHTLQSAQDTTISINTSNTLDCRINGFLDVTGATDASSNTTGGLTLSGGLGVAKGIVGASVTITNSTTSTSATTGALKVKGGMSTEENLHIGGVSKVYGTTNATSKTTGALIVAGGIGVSEDIHGKNVFIEDVVSNSVVILDTTTSDSATTGALKVVGGISTQENLHIGGVSKVYGTTNATSKTTGALIVAGGIGVSEDIHGKMSS